MKIVLKPASLDDVITLLRAWRFWLLGALIGGLLGAAFYTINPPVYRARATVVVSFNMEDAWTNKPDNELFYYLERESRKVEEVAWADGTLQQVAAETGTTVSQLRDGRLELSQPQDGGWHFYGSDPSADVAEKLAGSWAKAFTKQVQDGIQNAVKLDAVRKALVNKPDDQAVQAEIKTLEANSLAITPELQISLAQSSQLPVSRKSSVGIYVLAGTVLFWALGSLIILFFAPQISQLKNSSKRDNKRG